MDILTTIGTAAVNHVTGKVIDYGVRKVTDYIKPSRTLPEGKVKFARSPSQIDIGLLSTAVITTLNRNRKQY